MMRNLLRQSAAGKPIYGTPEIGLLASQIISETATGDQGPGLLYDDAQANTGKQLRVKITSWSGTPGTLFVYENGSILITGQADGAYVIGYDREAWASDGSVSVISDTASVTIGPVNASDAGGTGTSTGSGTGGDAVGGQAGAAEGGTGTGTGSGSGGDPTGGQSGAAEGGTGTGIGSGSGGEATGLAGGDASAEGGTGTGSGSGSGGEAMAGQSGNAQGGTGTGTGSGSGGESTGGTLVVYVRAPDGSGPQIIQPKMARPPNIGGRRT